MNRAGRFRLKASVVLLASVFSASANANPANPTVVAGQAVFQQNGKTLTVTNSPGAIINWQSFNIDRGELTRFIQQSAASQVLNRVTGGDPSKILGSLQSNGRVILINPNGVAFGAGAQVDVAGLLVSTLQIKDADYLAGKLRFNETPGAGSIKNEGTIRTASGGQVILIAPQIENSGLIHTPEGQILLAAGRSVTIADPDRPAIQVEVSNTEHKAINLGTLIGKEISLYGGLVKNSGTIQATTAVVGQNGKIRLQAKYEVENTGTLQANGAQGGDIIVQAEQGMARVQGLVEAKALTPQQVNLQQQSIEQKVQAASIVPAENVVVPPLAGSPETSVTLQAEAGVAAPSPLLETPWLKADASVVVVDSNTPQMTQPIGPLVPLDSNPLNPNTPLLPNRQQGQGGSVRIMGRLVRIDDGAAIDATGPGAGGEIVLGGGVSVTATPTPMPMIVWVGVGTTLDAGATENGAGGRIILLADRIAQDGVLRATGATAGEVEITAGQRFIQTEGALIDASGDTDGGSIAIRAGQGEFGGAFVSGTLRAVGASGKGGDILVTARNLHFAAAEISADGATDGGQVRLGGDYQGQNPALANASTNYVNTATRISANGASGQGGRVIVWSDSETTFGGTIEAKGATQAQGGFVEISSKELLHFAGTVAAKQLLLDPKNIIIDAAGSLASFQLVDPNPGTSNYFGYSVEEVGGGNIAVTSYGDSFTATRAGATYLFNGSTGALISTLRGSNVDDRVGSHGITVLGNGNYVILSPNWTAWTGAAWAPAAGAVTWGSGSTGVSGIVSAANSLVGSHTGDDVGSFGVTVLGNGNYVMATPHWANGSAVNAGAVTWGNGATGTVGEVSAANSLVGSQANDKVGQSITLLGNGNYVVRSHLWNNGIFASAGAVTWANGSTGISGVVSAANSLVGSHTADKIGYGGITALSNGNYVVASNTWNSDTGAATWGNGSTGIKGAVSSANSLVGGQSGDYVGRIYALTNGNYVVASPDWANGAATYAGAATWGNGSTGIVGVVSAANSLVGTQFFDLVSYNGITALTNGNYVVSSGNWANGVDAAVGAVTWGSGSTGIAGAVSAANSLVGAQASDGVGGGGTNALSNGNYVVSSSGWANGAATGAGAVTWGNGSAGTTGVVSAANSLVGTQANDQVGGGSITVLSNGNYVVGSYIWSNGAATAAGAATWGNGTTGVTGAVSAANSLVGTQANDNVGSGGITALSNGNYVVNSNSWSNGAATAAGAATWGNGTTGVAGAVSAANSLVGTQANDGVGGGTNALSNGNYVVSSSGWANGAATAAGAVTLGNGSTGTTGVVSAANSLVGTQANDQIGWAGGTVLSNGNYVVGSFFWANGAAINSGRVDIIPGTGGIFAQIFALNPSATATLNPAALTASLNAGTAVTLQANNDITINSAITANNPSGNGGALTLQAGRSILINANITTDNGALTLSANDPGANPSYRDPGSANITMAPGTTLNLGTGALHATLNGDSSGAIVLNDVIASQVVAAGAVQTLGSMTLNSLSISGGGLSLDLGASMSVAGLATIAAGSTLDINGGSISSGSLSVSGDLNLYDGVFSTGATTITNGGSFSITGGTPSFSGPMTVQAGGTLTYGLAGTTNIPGASSNAGTMNLNDGTINFVGGLTQSAGETYFNGGTLAGNFSVTGGVLGGVGTIAGALSLNGGSHALVAGEDITVTGGTSIASGTSLDLAGGNLDTAGLNVSGAFTHSDGNLWLNGPLALNSGSSFTLTGTGTLTLDAAFNQAAGSTLNIGGGTLELAGGGALQGSYGAAAGASLLFSGGTFSVTGATSLSGSVQMTGATFNGSGSLSNTGTLAVTGNTTFNTAFSNSGNVTLSNGVTLNAVAGYTQTAGSTLLGPTSGTSANLAAAGGVAINGGTFGGAGTVSGNLSFGTAILNTGHSPGALNITGNLTLGPSSITNIEVGGAMPGSGFDLINVSGSATLDGTLNVLAYGGYTPGAGSNFSFMNFASSSGAFASSNMPGGWSMTINSLATYLDLLAAGALPPVVPPAAALPPVIEAANDFVQGQTVLGFDRTGTPQGDLGVVQSLFQSTQFAQNEEDFLSLRQCQ
ncbi:MAG: filamentous hemagglutinin N-terminal domain-containing protein [Flavobacteriales bacterium]|nr:MAG: filamentous hemagglutinin N-terminal domain-containing protein [Flavobacteriales bacterium]